MIGLDTNVLVRYLVQDDAVQSPLASGLVRSFTAGNPGYLSLTALVETVWVLKRAYKVGRKEIAETVLQLASVEEIRMDQPELVRRAARLALEGHDFSDAVIGLGGRLSGCDYTATFDSKAAKLEGMSQLE